MVYFGDWGLGEPGLGGGMVVWLMLYMHRYNCLIFNCFFNVQSIRDKNAFLFIEILILEVRLLQYNFACY